MVEQGSENEPSRDIVDLLGCCQCGWNHILQVSLCDLHVFCSNLGLTWLHGVCLRDNRIVALSFKVVVVREEGVWTLDEGDS